MEYTVKEIKYGKNKMMYVPVFADESLKIFEEFLMTEVKSFKKQILEIIAKVIEQPSEEIEFAGNVCILRIKNGIAKIECNIDGAEVGAPAEIKFEEFVAVVNSWIKDTQK